MITILTIAIIVVVSFTLYRMSKEKQPQDDDFIYIISKEEDKIIVMFKKIQHFRHTNAHEIRFSYRLYFDWVERNMLNNYEIITYDAFSGTKATIVTPVSIEEYQNKLLDKTIKKQIKKFINEYKKSTL
jgi:hypothetical protein